MSDLVVILTTVPESFDAAALAQFLLSARLTACVSIVPGLRSLYSWQGAIHDDAEQQLVMKTTSATVAALRDALLARHPYDTPEFIVLPVVDGHPDYLTWVRAAVAPLS